MDAMTDYDHTALHWACVYGHAEVAEELIAKGCNTDLMNHRGKTAWDIAVDYANEDVVAVFEFFAALSPIHYPAFSSLRQERVRRERRPKVKDTFRDDIELDPVRLDFWSIEPFDQWKHVAEGSFGKVFNVNASPDVEIAGSRFRHIALKVPKREGVEELKSEVESLAHLSHPNVRHPNAVDWTLLIGQYWLDITEWALLVGQC